jgi:hypothetical protein
VLPVAINPNAWCNTNASAVCGSTTTPCQTNDVLLFTFALIKRAINLSLLTAVSQGPHCAVVALLSVTCYLQDVSALDECVSNNRQHLSSSVRWACAGRLPQCCQQDVQPRLLLHGFPCCKVDGGSCGLGVAAAAAAAAAAAVFMRCHLQHNDRATRLVKIMLRIRTEHAHGDTIVQAR